MILIKKNYLKITADSICFDQPNKSATIHSPLLQVKEKQQKQKKGMSSTDLAKKEVQNLQNEHIISCELDA